MQSAAGGAGKAGGDDEGNQRNRGAGAKNEKLSRADRMHQMGVETRGGRPKFNRQ